jgi:hypothetical protein
VNRLAALLSAAALAVALFGSTPLGGAARDAIGAVVPPFAKKAGYANQAGFAKNAGAVNGFKASRIPSAGKLLALGPNGRFPTRAGVIGPAGPPGPAGAGGPAGPAGPQGPQGVLGGQIVSGQSGVNSSGLKQLTVNCPSGKRAIAGGADVSTNGSAPVAVTRSRPTSDGNGWQAEGAEIQSTTANWQLTAFVFCAIVG